MADDLTQRLDAERAARLAAEQACREKDQLLAAVSHDLRTPVTAILMWVDVLRNHPRELTRGLAAIERSARAQTRILDDAMARIADAPPAEPAPEPAVLGAATAAADLAGIKVLVVEDEPDVRELLRWLLEGSQAAVITAASADEALAALTRDRPDVVISDIGMPTRDGFSLIRAIRGLDAQDGGQTPAVALTAFARPEDRTRALLAGYQFHLAKPVEAQELIAAITRLAGRRDR
jgi:CheY-like chemotaxis protein